MTTAVADQAATTMADTASTQAATTTTQDATKAIDTTAAATSTTQQTGATDTTSVAAPVTYTLVKPADAVIDDGDLATVTAMAKARGWTNEQAQAAANELNANLVTQAKEFKAVLDAHPEIGGTKFQAAQEHAMRALDRFLPAGTPEGDEFRTAMNKSGYGNYAPLMLFMSRIGKAMAEDKPFGAGRQEAQGAPAERLSDEEVFARTSPTWKPT